MDEMSPGKLVRLRKPDPRAHIKFSALLTLPKLPSALWPEVMASSFQLVVFPWWTDIAGKSRHITLARVSRHHQHARKQPGHARCSFGLCSNWPGINDDSELFRCLNFNTDQR